MRSRPAGNYIAEHRDELSVRHYIRKAGTEFYWFDFAYNKFREYQEQYGNYFCLVIYGSENEDDAYIMPYNYLQAFFSIDSLESNRARWIGNIKDDVVHLSGGKSISVAAYYNAFDLLGFEETDGPLKGWYNDSCVKGAGTVSS